MEKCRYCNKRLAPINSARKNGNVEKNDWDGRTLHKKCYKEVYTYFLFIIDNPLDDFEKHRDFLSKYKYYLGK